MINFISTGSDDGTSTSNGWDISGTAEQVTNLTSAKIENKEGLHPKLVFRFMKKKMSILGDFKYKKRIKKLEKLAQEYLDLGHYALSEKFLNKITEEMVFSEMYGVGIKFYLEKSIINKYKYKVRGGHISDTPFDKYTGVIPKNILKEKAKLEKLGIFDEFIIYHYFNSELEEKKEKKEPISSDEKLAMKDPILFGINSKLPNKLFFIEDWESEHCDLSFSELIDTLDVEEKEITITSNIKKE